MASGKRRSTLILSKTTTDGAKWRKENDAKWQWQRAWHDKREEKQSGMEGERKWTIYKSNGMRSESRSLEGAAAALAVDELPFERLNPSRRHTKWILSNAANHIEVLSVSRARVACGMWHVAGTLSLSGTKI